MVPQPAKAVILLFPISKGLEAKRKEEEAKVAAGDHMPVYPTVVWIKQTVSAIHHAILVRNSTSQIPNACGTIGLLHALLNVRVNSNFASASRI